MAEMVISIVQLQSSIKKTLIIRLHYPTCQTSEMLYNFKEMEETSSLQSLEELKNCRPSLFREEGKRTFVQKSWRLQGQVASSLNDILDILTNVENQSPTRIIKIDRNPCISARINYREE